MFASSPPHDGKAKNKVEAYRSAYRVKMGNQLAHQFDFHYGRVSYTLRTLPTRFYPLATNLTFYFQAISAVEEFNMREKVKTGASTRRLSRSL
jgi:hypothetical protein